MQKPTEKSVTRRRLILTGSLIVLFIIYLVFDLDFLITFDIDQNDVERLENPEIVVQSPYSKEVHDINYVDIRNESNDNRVNIVNDTYANIPPQLRPQGIKKANNSDLTKFGFDRDQWHQWRLEPKHCPYFNNICVHKQHFYVFNAKDAFIMHPKSESVQIFGTRIKNGHKSFEIYKDIFNARIWNKSSNEYELSHCINDEQAPNHIILSGNYMSMIGEFYLRILTALHWIFNEQEMMDKYDRNYKFYLMLPEYTKILLSHRLFMERFSKYELLQFVDLFEHYRCKCYQRLFFCGFHKFNHNVPNKTLSLYPKEEPFKATTPFMRKLNIFNKMINEYEIWINKHHVNIDQDVLKYKQMRLDEYDRRQSRYVYYRNGIKQETSSKDASKWRFIGLYQRTKRRHWVNLRETLRVCNKRYNEYKILCIEINLEDFLHSKDIILLHRSVIMLIGIHGATLTDAIWMENNIGNYIIELLPSYGPDWTSSLDKPSLSGILFWKSRYNYVALKLLNQSVLRYTQDVNKWYDNDFRVENDRLMMVIDFLIINDGGYCEKFKSADKIQIPQNIKDLGFAIYNAYCPQTPDVIHNYVKPRFLD